MIADQIMPGMRGDQLLIELETRHPQILKVMLTGQASTEDVGKVINQGNLYRYQRSQTGKHRSARVQVRIA